MPAHVYTAKKGQEKYSLTVVDYREAPRLLDEKAKATCPPGDERSCGLTQAGRGYWKEDMAGAVLWATYGFLQRNGKLTHLAFAWQDLIGGHEIQILNPDQSRTFAFVAMHTRQVCTSWRDTVPARLSAAGAVSAVDGLRRQERQRRCDISRFIPTCTPSTPMCSRLGRR